MSMVLQSDDYKYNLDELLFLRSRFRIYHAGPYSTCCFFKATLVAAPSAPSLIMIPRIQQLIKKKANEASHSPGKNVLIPRNSRLYPCCNQAAWPRIHNTSAVIPSLGLRRRDEFGRYNGRKTMYQRKYCIYVSGRAPKAIGI